MKKFLIIFPLFLFCFVSSAFAQEVENDEILIESEVDTKPIIKEVSSDEVLIKSGVDSVSIYQIIDSKNVLNKSGVSEVEIAIDSYDIFPAQSKEDLDLRTSDTLSFPLADGSIRYQIYSRPQFNFHTDSKEWTLINYATTTIVEADKIISRSYQSPFSFFKPANAQSTSFNASFDGFFQNNISYATFALMRAANMTSLSGSAEDAIGFTRPASWQYFTPGALLIFDTSSIPNDYKVSSSSLSIYISAFSDLGGLTDSQFAIALVPGYVADANTPPVPVASDGNLANRSSTRLASDKVRSTFPAGGFINFLLNATTTISLTAQTKLMLRPVWDISNVAPTSEVYVNARFSEYAGVAYDPYLSVVASPVVSPGAETSTGINTNIGMITGVYSDGSTVSYSIPFFLFLTIIFVLVAIFGAFIIFWIYGSSRR